MMPTFFRSFRRSSAVSLKVNYVVDPRIKGRVTFRAVSPVPQDNVLRLMEVILRLNGIGVVEDNGLYRLVPISDISKEPSPVNYGRDPEKIQTAGKALLQVVPVLYIPSSDVVKLITPFASSNAVLIDVPKGNQIIIVDTDANVKRLLRLIDIFDNEKLQKTKPQVFVYSVQNSKAKDIATVLQQTFLGTRPLTGTGAYGTAATTGAQQVTSSTTISSTATGQSAYAPYSSQSTSSQMLVSDFTRFIPDEITNSIIILSTPEEYALIRQAIDKIDTIPRQVVIEGLIAQVILTDNLSMGLSAYIRGSYKDITIGGGSNAGPTNRRHYPTGGKRPLRLRRRHDGPVAVPDPGPGRRIQGQAPGDTVYHRLGQPGGQDPGRPAGSPCHFGNLRLDDRGPPAYHSIPRHRHHPEGQTPGERRRSRLP